MWKIFRRLVLLTVLLYFTRPWWQPYAEPYVDFTFLDPVDQRVDEWTVQIKESEWIERTWTSIQEQSKAAWHAIRGRERQQLEEEVTTTVPNDTPIVEHELKIGQPFSTATATLGDAKRTLLNEYGTLWHLFHQDYEQFIMVAANASGEIVALYTNDRFDIGERVQYGMSKGDVRKLLGTPVTELTKGRTVFVLQPNDGLDVFALSDRYMYVFYDEHEQLTVTALLVVERKTEHQKSTMYAKQSQQLRNSYEQTLFELTNAIRVRKGVRSLQFHDALASTARKHSADMALHHFFDHTNLKGESPFERMRNDRIPYTMAGENLAYGQFGPIFAHEGLMNSYDHRMNTLTPQYTHVGIGVAFNQEDVPYFTQKFIK